VQEYQREALIRKAPRTLGERGALNGDMRVRGWGASPSDCNNVAIWVSFPLRPILLVQKQLIVRS
jgi:hypothetical protein